MNIKVAIGTSTFAAGDPAPLERLRSAGVAVMPNPHGRKLTEEETIAHLDGADGLIAGLEPLNRRVLASAHRLKAIARVGIGMDNVDQAAAADLGIAVSNTPDGPTEAVAEMCLTAALTLVRGLVDFNRDLHRGRWNKVMGSGLTGTVCLLVGYGRIGRRFGRLLRFLGAEILVHDPAIEAADLTEGETRVALDEGLARAEIISLHASIDRPLLGPPEFAQIRPGAVLLNSARGVLVDEAALMDALDKGIVRRAWLDAFSEEPYAGPLTRYDQVLMTPHVSTYTRQCRKAMETAAVNNLLRDLEEKRR